MMSTGYIADQNTVRKTLERPALGHRNLVEETPNNMYNESDWNPIDHQDRLCHPSLLLLLLRGLESSLCSIDLSTFSRKLGCQIDCTECCVMGEDNVQEEADADDHVLAKAPNTAHPRPLIWWLAAAGRVKAAESMVYLGMVGF
jgi:hypothetical protein